MKRLLVFIVSLCLVLVGCSTDSTNQTPDLETNPSSPSTSNAPITIMTLKGPTGMGMAHMMEENAQGATLENYTFNLVGAPDQVIGAVVKNEVNIAAVPSNLASLLYEKTQGQVQLLGVNTLGVLYVVENGQGVNTMADLKGKTLASSGKGATPEYVFNYLLDKNDLTLDDLSINYEFEHGALAAQVTAGEIDLAILPEPFVTSVLAKNKDLRIALNLNQVWAQATKDTLLPMGAIIVNKAFADENPDRIANFMKDYKASVDFVNSQPDQAGQLIATHGILPDASLASQAIPTSSIVLIPAADAKVDLMAYYTILYQAQPQSIGGKLPDESFFYTPQNK